MLVNKQLGVEIKVQPDYFISLYLESIHDCTDVHVMLIACCMAMVLWSFQNGVNDTDLHTFYANIKSSQHFSGYPPTPVMYAECFFGNTYSSSTLTLVRQVPKFDKANLSCRTRVRDLSFRHVNC